MADYHSKLEIIDYYDTCEQNYKKWWDLNRSHAMHAGYWDETTKTLTEALNKENEVLYKIAGLKEGDKVLDAGCGVGGSSIYLADKGCQATGITISEKQVETANKYAAAKKLQNLPKFLVMDYINTTFPDHTFDVVWAIESVCHADNKADFLREAYRILKPGGRVIVADGFNVRNEYNEKEKRILHHLVNGWAVNSMESIPNFRRYLQEQGFQNIHENDVTEHVKPSSRRLFFYSFPAIFYSKLGEYLGWSTALQTRDFKSYHYQYWAIKKELSKYMIFCAKKP